MRKLTIQKIKELKKDDKVIIDCKCHSRIRYIYIHKSISIIKQNNNDFIEFENNSMTEVIYYGSPVLSTNPIEEKFGYLKFYKYNPTSKYEYITA